MYFPFLHFFLLIYNLFLLCCNKIGKKQKFSTLDIGDVVTLISKSFFTSMITIFLFRCADPYTEVNHYYFADWLTENNSPNCLYNKKISCFCLIAIFIYLIFIYSQKPKT